MIEVAIVCATFVACFTIAAVFLERHKRYWQDRKIDHVTTELRAMAVSAEMRAVAKATEACRATEARAAELQAATDEHKTSKAELQKILDDAGKFSLDVSERLEALRMDLIRVETMIGMGGKR